ncbi:phosphotransferase enzyme family protein [Lachnoclostridium sp. Marseille-P6806]|uniref:phosphotransferase enzyme family protein n=1 Tax=Lachnoclostridium sp. Marseille-P6806 TaxID=2364793 RepID=UPI001030FF8F|nr:aminoglycoside phosphotransferase family protein [Lachnoclostridium sp. Marseille-P6806]
MTALREQTVMDAARHFLTQGSPRSVRRYGSGHINDTYLVECARPYILQRLNTEIFHEPLALMKNIESVTLFLREKITAQGGDPDRETLTLIPTQDGSFHYIDGENNFFRMFLFITDAVTYDAARNPEDFYHSAVAFGNFQRLLHDFPSETLTEVIPHFHDTPSRFRDFERAVQEDVMGRAASCAEEIRFLADRRADCGVSVRLQQAGELPLRVTHNDTKLNNIMLDQRTGEAICVIDLDTVMPGLSVNDFGDSIRFGANTAREDEPDASLAGLSLPLYESYVRGFLTGCGGILTPAEVRQLSWGAKLMTYECGMRFLGDYLNGDVYFHTAYPEHNLVRARTQIALVRDMERKWTQMNDIVARYAGQPSTR